MGVVGSIEITDRVTGVLRSIRKEQASFRKDVSETRNELERTWGRTHRAKLETGAASGKLAALSGTLRQFGRTVAAPVVKIKDMATNAVGKVTNKIRTVGRVVASPFIRLKDAATSGIKSISDKLKKIGKVFTPIVKLKDATTKGLSAIGGKLKSLGKNIVVPVAVAATVATTAIVTGAVMEGASLEQSIGGVETLFKGDASVVKANADAAFKTAGLSANEYMEQVTSFSASLLGSLGGDTAKAAGVADMAMIDMADNANKFGSDISSIQTAYQGFAKQNYTMLDNLKLGYGGTKEEMNRLLKDAGKLTGVKYDISNLSDVYNAIHAVQENLGVTGTTAKEAAETFSGSFSAMKASAKNLLGNMAIGGDVTGSMESLVENVSTFLFNNAIPMIGRVLSALPGAVITGIKNASPKIKEAGGEIVNSLKEGLISLLPSSMGDALGSAFDNLDNITSTVKPVIQDLGGVISTFAKSIKRSIPAIERIIKGFCDAFSYVVPVAVNLGGVIANIFPSILEVISTVVNAVLPIIQSFANVIQAIFPVVQGIIQTFCNIVQQVFPIVSNIITMVLNAVIPIVEAFAGLIQTALPIVQNIISIFAGVVETIFPVVQTIFQGLGEKIAEVVGIIEPRMYLVQEVFETVSPIIQSAIEIIADVLSTAWDVISPILDLAMSVFDLLLGCVERVFPTLQQIIQDVWAVLEPIFGGIADGVASIGGAIETATSFVGGGVSKVKSAIGMNADGDNNWRGGLTWVGEEGPEIVNLPRGSKILPNKESVSLASQSQAPAAMAMVNQVSAPVVNNIISARSGASSIVGDGVIGHLKEIELFLKAILTGFSTADTLKSPQLQPDGKSSVMRDPNTQGFGQRAQNMIHVTIAKIADAVHIKDESDMDSLAELVAGKVVEVAQNMI